MKDVEVQVKRDHLDKLTKASGQAAIMELIWNSLDADAHNIKIVLREKDLGIDKIVVEDDGNGINYTEAEQAFGSLGGSEKKQRRMSPGKRKLHGEEGQGRYKAFSLGTLVQFKSVFRDNGDYKLFDVTLDQNRLQHAKIDDLKIAKQNIHQSTGVIVTITNVNQKKASALQGKNFSNFLQENLAAYYSHYPDFKVWVGSQPINFEACIKNRFEAPFSISLPSTTSREFKVKILEWTIETDRKIYLSGPEGVGYHDIPLGIKTTLPISVYLHSEYIEKLHSQNLLLGEMDVVLSEAISKTRDIIRKYARERLQLYAKDFITDLKNENIYPFISPPDTEVEVAKRQVFDIVALQISEYVPKFNSQDKSNKKLTFALLKQALESDTESFEKIFTEIINLPKVKREELKDILEKTSLVTIIDTMKEVTDRLRILYELKLILFDKEIRKPILERKHLHKIVKNETWIFGDDFTYGADDVNLKNVLREYLKWLEREDFQEVLESSNNSHLEDIPDICLWKQYSLGESGRFKNLIIELKRPSKTIGVAEIEQIKKYARAVAKDHRFPTDKTKWVFYLLATNLNEDAMSECNQADREFGHVDTKENHDVYVKKWGELLSEAEARHQYLKVKLDYKVTSNEEGVKLLKEKYSEYLPDDTVESTTTKIPTPKTSATRKKK
jgi:hypothetical protein